MYHDTTTIFVFGAILLTFVGLLQVWLWEQDRRSHELGLWGVAHLLGGFGLALLVGRGLLPNRLSIDLGNAAIDLGGGLAWIGVRRFERRPAPISVAFVGAICWLIACQFDNFHNSPADRAGFGAVILGTYDALCVCEFLRRHVGGDLPSRRALAIIFAIDTVMNSIRLTAAMLQSSGQPALNLPGSQWFGWPAMLGTGLRRGNFRVADRGGEGSRGTAIECHPGGGTRHGASHQSGEVPLPRAHEP